MCKSAKAKALRHCGLCGKFSKNKAGEYTRKNGECGYINFEDGDKCDTCTDCREAQWAAEDAAK